MEPSSLSLISLPINPAALPDRLRGLTFAAASPVGASQPKFGLSIQPQSSTML
jgi:hypothetical protein